MNKTYVLLIIGVALLIAGGYTLFMKSNNAKFPNAIEQETGKFAMEEISISGHQSQPNNQDVQYNITKVATTTINGVTYPNFKITFKEISGELRTYVSWRYATASVVSDDTGFYVAIENEGYGNNNQFWIIKFDHNGAVKWAKYTTDTAQVWWVHLRVDYSKLYLYAKGQQGTDDYMLIFDKNTGELLESKMVDSNIKDVPTYNALDNTYYQVFGRVIKGDFSEYKKYASNYHYVIPLHNGNYLLVRHQSEYTFGGTDLQMTIVAPNGTVIKSWHSGSTGDEKMLYGGASNVMTTSGYTGVVMDNNYAYFFITDGINTQTNDYFDVIKVDRNTGQVVWIKRYRLPNVVSGLHVKFDSVSYDGNSIKVKLSKVTFTTSSTSAYQRNAYATGYYFIIDIDPISGNVISGEMIKYTNEGNHVIFDVYKDEYGNYYVVYVKNVYVHKYENADINMPVMVVQTNDLPAFGFSVYNMLTDPDDNNRLTVEDVIFG